MKWKRTKKHRIWRKDADDSATLGSWSRMIHKWWIINALKKKDFKKVKQEMNKS